MNPFNKIWRWLRTLGQTKTVKQEIDEELRFHIEQRTAENLAAGMSPEESEREARKRFGNLQSVREACREQRGAAFGETLLQDVRSSLRMLLKNSGFTVVAVLTLALGISVNAIIFSFASDFFLRPLPAQNPDRIVVIAQKAPAIDYQIPFSYADSVDLRRMVESRDASATDMARVFSGLMAYSEQSVHLSRAGESTERAWIHGVSDNYFSLLGAQPERGRFFLPSEGQKPGADPIIVLTHAAWLNHFNADPSIVGRVVKLNGIAFTVVGVAKPGFVGASWGTAVSGFVPVTMLRDLVGDWILNGGNSLIFLMGRLKPGVATSEARSAMDVALARLVQANPGHYLPNTRAVVMPERLSRPSPYISHHVPAIIATLMTLALLVLVIAGANVANLLYARAASREHELAIRSALGASRSRLLRGLLVESVLVAIGAGIVGILASFWLLPVVLESLPTSSDLAPLARNGFDWRPFVFGFVIALLTGIAAGMLPALKATGFALQPLLKNRSTTSGGSRHPMRNLLTVGQVAVSVVVLACAGLAVRSLHNLLQARLGFNSRNLALASFDLGKQRYQPDRGRRFQERLLEQVRGLPGVQSASLADYAPFDTRIGSKGGVVPEGQVANEHINDFPVGCVVAEHTVLRTLSLPLIAGREFAPQDGFGAPLVAIINQPLASRFWPGENPIGKRISLQGDIVEVVGVIGETRYTGIRDARRPLLIQPLAQNYRGGVTLLIRTEGTTAPVLPALEGIIRQMDPDLPLLGVQTMEHQIATSPVGLMPYRMGVGLAGVQGLIALFLAGLGIFGLVSFNVTCRTREIGVRMAVGATKMDIIRWITLQSLKPTFIGLILGLFLAFVLTRMLAGLLYGVGAADPVVFCCVVFIIILTTLLGAWIPVRRATKVDPVVVLRHE